MKVIPQKLARTAGNPRFMVCERVTESASQFSIPTYDLSLSWEERMPDELLVFTSFDAQNYQ